jgi:hypothetical protein
MDIVGSPWRNRLHEIHVKFLLYPKDSESYCLLILFHRIGSVDYFNPQLVVTVNGNYRIVTPVNSSADQVFDDTPIAI